MEEIGKGQEGGGAATAAHKDDIHQSLPSSASLSLPSPSASSVGSLTTEPTDGASADSSSSISEQLLSPTSRLEPSVLLHILSYLTGTDTLEHWKASRRSCPLCPMTNVTDPCITPELAMLRGHFRLVCKEWCRILGGPFLRSLGVRSVHSHHRHDASSVSSEEQQKMRMITKQKKEEKEQGNQQNIRGRRVFGEEWNGPRLFAGIKKVCMALPFRMVLDQEDSCLDSWYRELASLTPRAAKGECGVVEVRLEVEWGPLMEEKLAPCPINTATSAADEQQHDVQQQAIHHPIGDAMVAAAAGGGGILGGLGGVNVGPNVLAGGGGAMIDDIDDTTPPSSPPPPLQPPLLLPSLPPPAPGLVLREICFSNLGSKLTDTLAHTLLHHLPPTVEKISFARCSKLQTPFLPLLTPILPSLKELALDGCWNVDSVHLRTIEAARPKLTIDILHECFGNGRGGGGWQGRPCGMKEVVILTGRHRGKWVPCWVMHKAGPLRYHVFVCNTEKFDHAIGFSNRAALDISRKHLRHYCLRKKEEEDEKDEE